MKTTLKTLMAAIIAIAITGTAQAGAKSKLMNSIRKQLRSQEEQVVGMWMAGKRGSDLEKILADYVVKNIRLQAMGGTTSPLYQSVNVNGREYKSTKSLAKALVLEHYKRKGVDLGDMVFVRGVYSLKVVEER